MKVINNVQGVDIADKLEQEIHCRLIDPGFSLPFLAISYIRQENELVRQTKHGNIKVPAKIDSPYNGVISVEVSTVQAGHSTHCTRLENGYEEITNSNIIIPNNFKVYFPKLSNEDLPKEENVMHLYLGEIAAITLGNLSAQAYRQHADSNLK